MPGATATSIATPATAAEARARRGLVAGEPAERRPSQSRRRRASGRRQNRPAAGNRPANRPAAANRPANRPAASRPATRPAAQRPRAPQPAHLNRDFQSRQIGNQRAHASREAYRRPPSSFNRGGGGGFNRGGGGGFHRGGGGGGFHGGGGRRR
ncbi:MAG: hypothetical protein AcusKO_12570 [Acuticoccus sp.]